jgi:SAM-dependent methyltransferase
VTQSFDELVDEAARAPINGWDFSWLDGRATEARPSWRYSERVVARAADAKRMLEVQCGDGALLASLPRAPELLVAAEGYAPNLAIAAHRLRARGAHVVAAADSAPEFPFRSNTFDLVTCRHPIVAWWTEIARVLAPGGAYFAQHVGPRSVAELTEFLMGPVGFGSDRDPDAAVNDATAAGLDVVDLRYEELPMTFHDIGAVVYFLRLLIWIVPRFSVEAFLGPLLALHEQIERSGPFRATSTRFLIEARKPA